MDSPLTPDQANGSLPPGLQREPAAAFGDVFAQRLGETLGPWLSQLPQMLAQAIAQARPRPPLCAECVLRRMKWDAAHAADVRAAAEAAEAAVVALMAELGIAERNDPRLMPADPATFLPEHLRPHPSLPWEGERMPAILDAVTIAQGAWLCQFHIPGAPQPGHAGPLASAPHPLLLAPNVSVHAAAAAARSMPGMPGAAAA